MDNDVASQSEDNSCQSLAKEWVWEVDLGFWKAMDWKTQELIRNAEKVGHNSIEFSARGFRYRIDMIALSQTNLSSGAIRRLRRSERDEQVTTQVGSLGVFGASEGEHPSELRSSESNERQALKAKPHQFAPTRHERLEILAEHVTSPKVQLQLPAEAREENIRLKPEQVRKVFIDHVPGVEQLLFRNLPGEWSLKFIVLAYEKGVKAFQGTSMHKHLLWLMRSIVHYGYDNKPGAASYLREVADAFQDCQAVQARVIERVGLEIRGVNRDFGGSITSLLGDYKYMALKMLACWRIQQGMATDDGTPTHYENRLIADIGDIVGLNKDAIRRAHLDEHAKRRFRTLDRKQKVEVAQKFREFLDMEAFVKGFIAEVNSLTLRLSKTRCLVNFYILLPTG